ISIIQLFGEINKKFENRFRKVYGPAKAGEQKTSCLKFSKICNDFGWSPKYNLQKGIEETYNWFKVSGNH
ncbi:hypothetical protein ACFLY1_01080, partial [Patescibacteria group bacterium]